MAISFDKSGSANAVANTATVTIASATSSELAIMFVVLDEGATLSTLTVNGSSAGVTQVGSTFDDGDRVNYVYYLQNPPTSSVAYVATGSIGSSPQLLVQLYSNADVPNANAHATNATTNITLTVNVVTNNSWLASLFSCYGSGSNSNAGGTGTTQRENLASQSSGDSNATVGTGNQSMGWTGGRTRSSGFIIAIPPLVTSASSSLMSSFQLLGVGT